MTESWQPHSHAQTTRHELQWKEKSVPEKAVGDGRGELAAGMNHRQRKKVP